MDASGGHIYICCTDTRDWDQSEIKLSSYKIGDNQAIKMSVCTAQSRSRWVLSFDSTHTPPTSVWQSRVKDLLAVWSNDQGPKMSSTKFWSRSRVSIQQVYMWPPLVEINFHPKGSHSCTAPPPLVKKINVGDKDTSVTTFYMKQIQPPTLQEPPSSLSSPKSSGSQPHEVEAMTMKARSQIKLSVVLVIR